MLRSMYSGISGMKNFQTKLDVIGNNIANVNTYGFKKGRVIFKDLISQNVSGASAPTGNRGGVNPKQVGLGSQMASIDTMHESGSLQTTGRVLDLAIAGDGYFIVGDAAGQDQSYTRAGNFYLDNNGNLVNGDGLFVLGQSTTPAAAFPSKINVPSTATEMSISKNGTVTYINAGALVTAGQIMNAKFANTGGLQKTGNNLFKITTNSGAPVRGFANTPGFGSIESSQLEMSNVDLSEEFTEMIVAQRGFQANTRIITTSDEILQELVNLKR
ncbi:flagellar basal body rod protein FlgG [Peribacillus cavernae]|uniref:Flagellar basal body rod protein FlgG n=1 Tax=Peribacillus cavernae TaxID=1674310 RepID=A0A433HQG1_9BACI|nr:flagellar basal body rod protein FlgG [Peribacillus cavernae]MDQ0217070.1 flagellar hook protein FlgE [Peribacillus cavernae]RUQ30452.1 flagellar basal body rod protein FlgG [Peribacillus cavernae]